MSNKQHNQMKQLLFNQLVFIIISDSKAKYLSIEKVKNKVFIAFRQLEELLS